jgi:hypothetical protein
LADLYQVLERDGFKVRQAQRMLGIDANPPIKDALPNLQLDLAGVFSGR